MTLFIASEVMFFVAWFWAYFDISLFPNEFVGNVWPPKDIETFDPWDIPLINTLVLLLSGTTVTWAHHSLIEGDRKGFIQGLTLTVILGFFLLYFKLTNIIMLLSIILVIFMVQYSIWQLDFMDFMLSLEQYF
jgi:heme/copper-type cytochrome/quinol oxidase subunit 3